MARIPDAELERIKREVDLVALVEASGVKLTRQGRDFAGLCPFHEDREPSLVVSAHKVPPVWRCFGCDTGGSAIDWVMKRDGVSFREAVARLAPAAVDDGPSREHVDAASEPNAAAGDDAADAETSEDAGEVDADGFEMPVLEPKMDDRAIGEAVAVHYHATLLESPQALAYIERRGLASPELITHFRIGYADGSLLRRIYPPRRTRMGQAFRRRLGGLGWVRARTGKEHMHGRITVPIVEETGAVVQMYGRTTGNEQLVPKHLYMPGPMRAVFNWQALLEHQEVILCEALFDAMTFWSAGYRNVTAAYGTAGFLPVHLEALRRFGTTRVLIAYDRDEQGDKAAVKLGEELMATGIECFRVRFLPGLDANAHASKLRPAAASLGLAIRSAQWMGKGRPPAHGTVAVGAAVVDIAAVATTSPATCESVTTEPAATATPPLPELAEQLELATPEPTDPAPAPTLADLAARAAADAELASSLAARLAAGAPAPAASPALEATDPLVPHELNGEEVLLWLADRRYRVRGLAKNTAPDVLKVNLMATRGEGLHVDTLDLYSARQRLPFCKQAATELSLEEDVVRHDLRRVLLQLEQLQRDALAKTLAPEPKAPVMTPEEREEALALARDPELLERIAEDLGRCGLVGEQTNKQVCYLAATSRMLGAPLAVVIQSSSSAGKTAVMEAVLAMMPEEQRIKYSAMTGQSLFYMSEQDLKHKILALVEEEGAERASYALKLLQSEGELTIASTGKDPQSGRLVTHEYRVEGPVAILLTTTAIEIDEELLNRCLVLTVDEGREQTRAILALQREEETLEGYWAREERRAIRRRHQNLQRLLRPLVVVNPLARELTFQDSQTRTRRDHRKYLTLMRTIALLHQHQRPTRLESRNGREVEVLEVTAADVALANRLASEVLGRSLDELAPQTRRLLEALWARVREESEQLEIEPHELRFLLREARTWTGFGQTQLKIHLGRLVDLEYVVVHRGGRGQSFVYELAYAGEGQDGSRFVPRLADATKARRSPAERSGSFGEWSGETGEWSGVSRGRIGPESGGSRVDRIAAEAKVSGHFLPGNGKSAETAHLGVKPPARPAVVNAR